MRACSAYGSIAPRSRRSTRARRRDVVIFPPLRVFFLELRAVPRSHLLFIPLSPIDPQTFTRSKVSTMAVADSKINADEVLKTISDKVRSGSDANRPAARRSNRSIARLDVAPPKAPSASARSLFSLPAVFSPKRPPVAVVNARPSPIRRDRLTNRSTNRSRSLPPRSGKTPRTSPR